MLAPSRREAWAAQRSTTVANMLTCVLHGVPLLPETETHPSTVRIAGATFSLRVLAAAIILLFFYYAAGVVITVALSILLAYFLDPAVEFL